jgi:hypothetical protein
VILTKETSSNNESDVGTIVVEKRLFQRVGTVDAESEIGRSLQSDNFNFLFFVTFQRKRNSVNGSCFVFLEFVQGMFVSNLSVDFRSVAFGAR